MRENRSSGSEGGATAKTVVPTPIRNSRPPDSATLRREPYF